MGQNAQSSRSFIKTLWGCTRTLNCYRILGVPGPKCFNPEFGELVFSLTLCDVADAMDAVYVVDAVDALKPLTPLTPLTPLKTLTPLTPLTPLTTLTSSRGSRASRLRAASHVFTSSRLRALRPKIYAPLRPSMEN